MATDKLLGYCGIDCAQCPAYVATQADDQEAKDRLLAEWRVQFNSPEMPPEAVTCDGCTSSERLGGYCALCEVRKCGVEKGVATCAACADYGCATLEAFIGNIPAARANLDAVRSLV